MAVIIRRSKPEPQEDPWLKVIRGEDPDPARGLVIKRNKPIVIKRNRRPPLHSESREGGGWKYERGFPPDRTKRAYHVINVHGVDYAFLWEPAGRLGEEWTAGKWSCSPGVMGCHDYRGECTIVIRSSSTPDPVEQARSKWRRR